jgi:hypothetical protein
VKALAALTATLTRRTNEELRARPRLLEEHQRLVGRSLWERAVAVLSALFLLALIATIVFAAMPLTFQLMWALGIVLATCLPGLLASTLGQRLVQQRQRLLHLPVPDAFLIDLELRAQRRVAWIWLGVFGFMALLAAIAWWLLHPDPASRRSMTLALAGVALLHAATVHALSLVLLRWLSATALGVLALISLLALLVVPIWGLVLESGPMVTLAYVASHPRLALVTPLGWAPYGVLRALQGHPEDLVWVAPAVLCVAALPLLHRSLRKLPWAALPEEVSGGDQDRPTPDEVLERVRSGTWLTGWGSEPRGLAHLIDLSLTPRQQDVHRFVFGQANWTRRWAAGIAGALTTTALVAIGLTWHPMILWFPLLAGGAMALPLGDELPGLKLARTGATWTPRYAYYAVTKAELSAVLLRVGALRSAAFLAPLFALAGLLGLAHGFSAVDSWVVASKLIVVYMGLFPVLIANRFSSLLTNSFRMRWLPVLIVVGIVIATAVAVLLRFNWPLPRWGPGGISVAPGSLWSLAAVAVVWATGWGWFLFLRRGYRHRDLVGTVPPSVQVAEEAQATTA